MIMTAFHAVKNELPRFFWVLVALLCMLPLSCTKTADDDEDDEEEEEVVDPFEEYSDTIVINLEGVSYTLRKVIGGTFSMGTDTIRDPQSQLNERIVHEVTLSSYYIGETEVSQEFWNKVLPINPSEFKGDKLPVESASYRMVVDTFIRALNNLTGRTFRLPTEAEWEFAARGGIHTRDYKYSGSNNVAEVAWHSSNSDYQTHPIKTKACNELYLYDMSGNVGEWCSDWYDIYNTFHQTNPHGPSFGSHRVVRGGSWVETERYVRNTCRARYLPGSQNHFVGFRLVLDAE